MSGIPIISTTFVFLSDGRFLATGYHDKTAIIWDVETGESIHRLEGFDSVVESVGFSPDGRYLATGLGNYNTLKLWDVETGQEIRSFFSDADEYYMGVNCLQFSPDGRYLAIVDNFSSVRLLDVHTGQTIRYLNGHDRTIKDLSISPEGRFMVTTSGSYAERNKLWHLWPEDIIQNYRDKISQLGLPPFVLDVRTIKQYRLGFYLEQDSVFQQMLAHEPARQLRFWGDYYLEQARETQAKGIFHKNYDRASTCYLTALTKNEDLHYFPFVLDTYETWIKKLHQQKEDLLVQEILGKFEEKVGQISFLSAAQVSRYNRSLANMKEWVAGQE